MRNTHGFFLLLIFVFLVSCRTAPPMSDPLPEETGFIPLDPGAFAYITADAQKVKPLLNDLAFINMDNKQLQQMFERTQSAAAAIYRDPDEETTARYQLVAWGNYPASMARMGLGFSKGWKKQRVPTGAAYWYSAHEGLAIALDQRQIRIASAAGNRPVAPFAAAGTAVPQDFGTFSKGTIIACWLNEPGPLINRKLQEMGLPIEIPAELVFAGIVPAGVDQYQVNLNIQVPSASQARAIAALLGIARFLLPADTSGAYVSGDNPAALLQTVLFANPAEQNDKNLIIKTAVLSSRDISLLFSMFSL